jgi:hypothetical protein
MRVIVRDKFIGFLPGDEPAYFSAKRGQVNFGVA